jgi:hypothetical protein
MTRTLLCLASCTAAILAVGCACPHVEYSEIRWEVGPTTRSVTLETPGDQYKGVWFQDALDHTGLKRPLPSNTPKATSTDLLTVLSSRGWKLVTHAIDEQSDDLHVEVWTLRRRAR